VIADAEPLLRVADAHWEWSRHIKPGVADLGFHDIDCCSMTKLNVKSVRDFLAYSPFTGDISPA